MHTESRFRGLMVRKVKESRLLEWELCTWINGCPNNTVSVEDIILREMTKKHVSFDPLGLGVAHLTPIRLLELFTLLSYIAESAPDS